jgi:hypothetical protein
MKCQSDGDFEAQSEGSYEYPFQVEVEACSLKQGLRSSGDVVRHVRAQVRRGQAVPRVACMLLAMRQRMVPLLEIRSAAVELTERFAATFR